MSEKPQFAGEILNFDVKPYVAVVNSLLASDEFERAMWVCDNLPGWYRDNKPREIRDIQKHAYDQWMGIKDYVTNPHDLIFDVPRSVQALENTLRGQMISAQVKEANDHDVTPHIIDMGPGEFWLPMALKDKGLKFTYYGHCLQQQQENIVKEHLGDIWKDETPDKHVMFVATEIIEHLTTPSYDILNLFYRKCPNADLVYLSTPLYTFGGGLWDWADPKHKGFLGHLRTYTPKEFFAEASKMFPGYALEYIPNEIMMIKGTKIRS